MPLIPSLGSDTVDRFENGQPVEVSRTWRAFFNTVFNVLSALTQSGATAARPTSFLWTGRTFYDTDLGLPIWWNGTDWTDAAGSVV